MNIHLLEVHLDKYYEAWIKNLLTEREFTYKLDEIYFELDRMEDTFEVKRVVKKASKYFGELNNN